MSIPSRLFKVSMLLVCSYSSVFSQTQTGCYVPVAGAAGRSTVDLIYNTPQPGEPEGKFYTTTTSYRVSCPSGAGTSTLFAGNIRDAIPGAGCWVEYKGGGTQYPNNYWQNGRVVTFTILQCPIDDFSPFILIGAAGLGFEMIRRNRYKR